jgi:ABC-type protease/lipase transport system fused ATPase/permease subunit
LLFRAVNASILLAMFICFLISSIQQHLGWLQITCCACIVVLSVLSLVQIARSYHKIRLRQSRSSKGISAMPKAQGVEAAFQAQLFRVRWQTKSISHERLTQSK